MSEHQPSAYRYRRGCRCDACVEAWSVYRREYRRRKAEEEGRVHGEKPCVMCGKPFNVIGSSNARKYCAACTSLALKESRRASRERRDERAPGQHVAYMREYYRTNKQRLRVQHREYYEANREAVLEQCRRYHARNAETIRARLRAAKPKKNTPTAHERALEAFNFGSSEGRAEGAKTGSPSGFKLRRCKCGCGMYVNAAHIAVARLFRLGYSRQQIAARLGVHPTEVSQLKLDGDARTWPWYRRGHGNLSGLQQQPVKARRRVPKQVELRLLVEQQETEMFFGTRQKSVTGRSLDAAISGTDGLTLADKVAAPAATGDYTDAEESLFDWLYRNGVNLEELADRCADDPALAAALAESTELGHPTAQAIELLATDDEVAA